MSLSPNKKRAGSVVSLSPNKKRAGSVVSLSPNKKRAGGIIKRAVVKYYARGKYRNYTGRAYTSVRSGALPTHTAAITRRMRMFPLTTKAPLYRGVGGRVRSSIKINKVMSNGKLVNNSISSFSYNRNTARFFAGKRGFVLVLPPGRYPAINARQFIGNRLLEKEVTLYPGTFYVTGRNEGTGNVKVRYVPRT